MEEAGELIGIEGLFHLGEHLRHPVQHIPIQLRQLFVRHCIFCGVEIVQVPQQEPRRIANLAVDVRHLLENIRSQGHIVGIVHRRHPQPQHVGTVGGFFLLVVAAVNHHFRIDGISQGFRLFVSLFIQSKPVGENLFVGGRPVVGDAGQQTRLEPTPMLVGTFEVDIHRIA